MKEPEKKPGEPFSVRVGDFVENSIERQIVRSKKEAPYLRGEPEPHVWYRVAVPEGITGDGSDYYIYIKKGNTENLCVFLSGGGVAWNEYTAARPVDRGKGGGGTAQLLLEQSAALYPDYEYPRGDHGGRESKEPF